MKVLKFGAVWCAGCLVMRPLWEKIEADNPWLEAEYFDVDENKQEAHKYNLTKYPAFIFLDKNGEEIDRLVGEVPREKIEELINKYKSE